ncbi:MAG: hypothetical protein E7264_11780 [Lachnospiraceae bacterium]|nr:hypothetical protein [Lachnospiraceae bacterium]
MEDLHGVRYMFEHRLLPGWFFDEGKQLVAMLLHEKSILFELIDDIFTKEGVENPYKKEDFDVDAAKITDEVMMLKIIFPEPEDVPLCYCSYMFFNMDFDKIDYFCIERAEDNDSTCPFVCSWTQEGSHINYGRCSSENNNDLIMCADIYMKKQYGFTRDEDIEED